MNANLNNSNIMNTRSTLNSLVCKNACMEQIMDIMPQRIYVKTPVTGDPMVDIDGTYELRITDSEKGFCAAYICADDNKSLLVAFDEPYLEDAIKKIADAISSYPFWNVC